MRPILRAALVAVLIFALPISARSQTSSDPLTADQAVREALAANRDLQAARFSIDVARGGLLQAGLLNNPELAVSYLDDFAFDAENERSGSVSLAQSFPVTARLVREKDVAGKDIAIAEAEVRNFVRNLVAETQRAFYRVRARDEQLDVNDQLVASIREVEDTTARRVEAAEASPAEVGLLRIERLRLEQNAQRLIREREVAAAALARLLGRETPKGLALVGELDPAESSGPARPSEFAVRPDLEAANRGVERADADRALARSQVWEDWTLGFGYLANRDPFGGAVGVHRDKFLTFDVTIPFPLWNRQQGRIAAAAAEKRRSSRSRDALVLRVKEEIRAAQARVRTLRTSVDAYTEQILPEATRTQRLFERGYRQGLMGIAELFQAQRQYNQARAFYIQLLGDLRQAAIQLEAATGASPYLNKRLSPGGNTP